MVGVEPLGELMRPNDIFISSGLKSEVVQFIQMNVFA